MSAASQRLSALRLADLGGRPVLLAPHPDDEALACGGMLSAAAAAGASPLVVFVTDGEGYERGARALRRSREGAGRGALRPEDFEALGEARRGEARAAVQALGLAAGGTCFLGYPDGGIARLGAEPRRGRSGRDRTGEHAYHPGRPFVRDALVSDLADALREVQPTSLLVPHPADTHPDHACMADIAVEALGRAGIEAPVFAGLVHRYTWPWAYPRRRGLRPPASLVGDGEWLRFEASPESLALKAAAIEAHASQTAIPDLSFFMRAFLRHDEWVDRLG